MNRSLRLLALLPRRPVDFFNRVAGGLDRRVDEYLRAKPEYAIDAWPDILARVGGLLDADLSGFLSEDGFREILAKVQTGLLSMPSGSPFPNVHNGDFRVARLSYAAVRALRPSSVVETGVCYGVTSAFILKALEQNGAGQLYSIDLPPLGSHADKFVGWLVPQELRSRWRLFLGPSCALLPHVLSKAGRVGMFLHDSLHTYRNIRRELAVVSPALSRPGVVLADDIEGNSAFLDWTAQSRPTYWAAMAEEAKKSLLGVSVFASTES